MENDDGGMMEILKHEDLNDEQRQQISAMVEGVHTFLHATLEMSGQDPQLLALGFIRWLGCHLYGYEPTQREMMLSVFKQNLDRIPEYWSNRTLKEAQDAGTTKH